MTALLWGLPGDPTMAAVRGELARRRVPTVFLDQRDVLACAVRLEVGAGVAGCLCVAGTETDLAGVSAAYLRPHDSTLVASVRRTRPGSPERRHARELEDAMLGWADLTPAYVVSRPSAAAANGSKPYHLAAIAAAGFAVPDTLVTNDPAVAWSFVRRHGTVVYKSVSAVRSRVRRIEAVALSRTDLADVAVCPTQFQARVPGVDVRVHVVGVDVFATRVASAADDYRYAAQQGLPRAHLEPFDLPDDVAVRCRALADRLALPVAGIDLRVTPDGTWYCFEANPSPAFSYYEAATGQPIARAVAGLLAAAVTCAAVPASTAGDAARAASSSLERITLGRAEVFRSRLLTEPEAAAVTETLLAMPAPLRGACWTLGEDGVTTIGSPLYRTRDQPARYAEAARATNAALYGSFRELHERVAALFADRYRCPVAFVDELAIPGFHLFEYPRAGRYDGGGWHFDQLAQQVPYFAERDDEVEGILNFTLPLAVPSGGTGMELHDDEPGAPSLGSGTVFAIPYSPGVIVFNEHEYWHRIGPSTCHHDAERRLTLQGHGVRFRGRLLLFW